MLRPDFFEPKPLTENIRIKFEEVKGKLDRRKPVIIKRSGLLEPVTSTLGKRKAEEAFKQGMNDDERYGQEIPPDFFTTNLGHNAFPSRMEECITLTKFPDSYINKIYQDKLTYWYEKYQIKR
jgi:hypothetical protein